MRGFKLEDFNELCRHMDRSRPSRCAIPVGLKAKIRLNTYCMLAGIKLKIYWTDTRRAYDYAEITPYNKGSLWKVRCFAQGHYHVYYGTVKKAYCTTIQEVINFINIKP